MIRSNKKRLVVDACVACSMGERNQNGKFCRDFMDAFRFKTENFVVMTEAINSEWKKHARHKFSSDWLCSMHARRRVVKINEPSNNELLRSEIISLSDSAEHIDAMIKDVILLEAALLTDRTIISIDKIARRLFSGTCERIGCIRDVVWVNPCTSEESAVTWLVNGAKNERERQLCNYTSGALE